MAIKGQWVLSSARCTGQVVHDSSGEGNDGAAANVPVFANDHNGAANGAMVFNGVDDAVEMGSIPALDENGTFSIAAWIKPDDVIGVKWVYNQLINPTNRINMGVTGNYVFGQTYDGAWAGWVYGPNVVSAGTWAHFVFTGNAGVFKIYLNGSSVGVSGVAVGSGGAGGKAKIGNNLDADTQQFKGNISDVRVYDQELTQAAVTGIYSGYAQALGGILTPTGALTPIPIFVQALGGTITPSGILRASNPAWLLMDETLRWMGEWSAITTYNADDVVLYKATGANEWHVFISKAIHNTNNIPTSSSAWWRRLYQEPLA